MIDSIIAPWCRLFCAEGGMTVREIAAGFWRWTAPHPAWTPDKGQPGGWERLVGCLYYEPVGHAADAIVLVDPLAPPADESDAQRFWTALDRDVERAGLPLAVLVSNRYHGRSTREIYRRYAGRVGVTVHVPAGAEPHVACDATHRFTPGSELPAGVEAHFVEGLVEPEVAFFIPPHRALVFADAVIGAGGGTLRVAPRSWADAGEEAGRRYAERLRPSLASLLALDAQRVLPSHGDPVLESGCRRLAEALAAPAWGERGDRNGEEDQRESGPTGKA